MVDALTAPISLEIWVLGIAFAAAFVDLETRIVHDIISLSLIVAVAWVLVRLTRNVQTNLVEMSREETDEEGNIHYFKAIPEYGGRVLHVVVNPNTDPHKVVTLFFDRRLRR